MERKPRSGAGSASSGQAAAESSAKVLLQVLAGRAADPPPIWLMRQAGRYLPEYRALRRKAGQFLDLCLTPELAVEATLQPIRRYGFDAAILFSDILVVPHALGQEVSFEEGRGPRLRPIQNAADLDCLSGEGQRGRLRPVYAAIEEVRRRLPGETTLIGFAGAPWTVATYMLEGGSSRQFRTAKEWMAVRPKEFARLMELLVDSTFDHLSAQVSAGAEALQIFDTWAGVLAAEDRRRWSLAPLSEIVARLKAAHPEVPVILFPRGTGEMYLEFACRSGADALSLDPTVSLEWARAELQPCVAVQGNLDPRTLADGGPQLDVAARRILDAFRAGPFIFNLGHGILPETKAEAFARLVQVVRG